MRNLLLFLMAFGIAFSCYSQISFPVNRLENIFHNAPAELGRTIENITVNDNVFSGPGDFLHRSDNRIASLKRTGINSKSGDTLYIGLIPGDSLYITGDYIYDGTIVVWGDGKLVFENANATVYGDLLVYGEDARVWITNSTMRFPQSYMYQRGILAGMNAIIQVVNSTFDYYGISHDLTITDNATVSWHNVNNIGFTTCGLNMNAQMIIDSANQAGEYIMKDNASGSFSNAETLLVWHHIADTAVLDFTFPDGDTITSLSFDNSLSGLTNIDYSYDITNCTDVMWGLMPEPGSAVEITDSKIRTVGVWFRDLPDYNVSGLVNNSHYNDFTAPISSHNIRFVNTDVQTWSLYMFDNAHGNVDNCILGEVGTMVNSSCTINNSMIDGSGGYLFANDTTIMSSYFSYLNCNFQTSGNAFGIMAYGGQNMGRCIGFEKSIMIIIQANLIYNPEIYDDAMVFYLKLEGSSTEYTNSVVPVYGSAFIEHASDYYSNDLDWYLLEYSIGSEGPWMPVCDTVYGNEVFSGHLCDWDTEGLVAGNYLLRLTICDNTPDQNKVEAVKQYTLIPPGTQITDLPLTPQNVFPNPVKHNGTITIVPENDETVFFNFYDENGKYLAGTVAEQGANTISLDKLQLTPGIIYIEFLSKEMKRIGVAKVVVE